MNEWMKNKQYYSISEVSKMLDIKEHIIRYWDSKLKINDICVRLNTKKRRQFNALNIKRLKEVKEKIRIEGKHNTVLQLTKVLLNNKNQKNNSLKNKYNSNKIIDIKSLEKISKSLKKLLES